MRTELPAFEPGIALSGALFAERVQPLMASAFPDLPYSAALIGPGSEVLGCDTPMSADHDWAARVHVFVAERDAALAPRIAGVLRQRLPAAFRGHCVLLPVAELSADGVSRAFVGSARSYIRRALGWDPLASPCPADWLSTSSQVLLELTAGAVYRDDTGELTLLRESLAWYPRDVWLYMLAAGWQRIGQEEHLMARAGIAGDELGSAIIGARLARDLMMLAYLMAKRYPPYAKWFGTLFCRLDCSTVLTPLLKEAVQAPDWRGRESALMAAAGRLVELHNALGITEYISPEPRPFFDRPHRAIGGERIARALCGAIEDPAVRLLLSRPLIGALDQWSDSTDLKRPAWRYAVRHLIGALPGISPDPQS